MQLLFCRLTFTENDAFIRTDSLVTLCSATLLCRVTQFPVCAVQNLRGEVWWQFVAGLSALLHFTPHLLSLLWWGVVLHGFLLVWCSTNFVHSRYYLCCLSQYRVQKKTIFCSGKIVLCSRGEGVCGTSWVIIPRLSPAVITLPLSLPPSLTTLVTRQTRHIIFWETLFSLWRKHNIKRNDFETSKNTGDKDKDQRLQECKTALTSQYWSLFLVIDMVMVRNCQEVSKVFSNSNV